MLSIGGIYIIDDLLPQDNWPEGHEEKLTADDVTDWVVMTPVGPMGPSDAGAIREFLSQFTN